LGYGGLVYGGLIYVALVFNILSLNSGFWALNVHYMERFPCSILLSCWKACRCEKYIQNFSRKTWKEESTWET